MMQRQNSAVLSGANINIDTSKKIGVVPSDHRDQTNRAMRPSRKGIILAGALELVFIRQPYRFLNNYCRFTISR